MRSKQGRQVHGKLAFYYHTVMELLRYRAQDVRVRFDDGETIDVHTALVVAANGRYFGSGMMIAPDAAIDDGQFDVLVYRAEGKLQDDPRFQPDLPRRSHLAAAGKDEALPLGRG